MELRNVFAHQISIGKNVVIEPTAVIRGLHGNANTIHIGDNTYIGHHVQIICDNFSVGDYGKIHHHTNIHGYLPCQIGHNLWCGQHVVIDSIGGVTIGDNCGIGAYSQLWSHIKYGDTLDGCRFNSEKHLQIGKDVWFVGHCLVSPIVAADRSMAMLGSVVTSDMAYNTIYAGVPARPVTDALGQQFMTVPIDQKMQQMHQHLQNSGVNPQTIRIVESLADCKADGKTYFAVADRQYIKQNTPEEIAFMRYLLPEKAKFTPYILP
jgi:acetyltransferase-like isoleucine patch superfamily enzyme